MLCEAGLASSIEDAERQDVDVAEEILQMRYFAHVYDDMGRDKKSLTPEREKYLEMMEKLSNEFH